MAEGSLHRQRMTDSRVQKVPLIAHLSRVLLLAAPGCTTWVGQKVNPHTMASLAPEAAPKASAPLASAPTRKNEVVMEGSLLNAALRMSAMAKAASEVHPPQPVQSHLTQTYVRTPRTRDGSSVLVGIVEIWEHTNIESGDTSARLTAVQRPVWWTGRLGGIWHMFQWVETWRLAKWSVPPTPASETMPAVADAPASEAMPAVADAV